MKSGAFWLVCLVPILLFTTLAAAGPSTKPAAPTSGPATRPAAAVEDDVFEAVFRYQFEHNGSLQKQNAAAYYLHLSPQLTGGDNPDDAFMKRFAGHRPPVRKVSQRKLPAS